MQLIRAGRTIATILIYIHKTNTTIHIQVLAEMLALFYCYKGWII